MRPDALTPLFAQAQSLPGIGPRFAQLLAKALAVPAGVAEPRVIDLLWHLPTGAIDRRAEPTILEAAPGAIATLKLRVLTHWAPPPNNPRAPYRVFCEDDTSRIDLVFFRVDPRQIVRQLAVGQEYYVSGRFDIYNGKPQMSHPDYMVPVAERDALPPIEPVYPLTAGLLNKTLQKAVRAALDRLPHMEEWQDRAWLAQQRWPDFKTALHSLHAPQSPDDLAPQSPARQRLAYDELLAGQLTLALVRNAHKAKPGRSLAGDGHVRRRIMEALPFALTGAQTQAIAEIAADLAAPRRMLRLLQGDVGSGKTVVALLAMAIAKEAGAQAALMAPTEVLARQHAESLTPLALAGGLELACLTGREKGRARRDIVERLAAGGIDILVGTHALLQPDVIFRDLALAVVDEQHRFGVHQRLALQSKGRDGSVDILTMTATPIPRTLLMTHYGDLDVSRLTEKPPGRKPVVTTATSLERLEEAVDGLGRALKNGAQIYWVCPLVEASDVLDLTTAEARFAHLQQIFGDCVGLLHGSMTPTAKDAAMAAFARGALSVLVATTVIEVGVNVPNASIMVVENAERFGLAQLHQLRGRVGRGERASFCVLLYKPPLGRSAQARLDMLRATEDGFLIAEKDLELRGGGEVLGARQSGDPEFRVANVPDVATLLAAARDDARLILATDPRLTGPRGQALKMLLYLFECDAAVRLFQAA